VSNSILRQIAVLSTQIVELERWYQSNPRNGVLDEEIWRLIAERKALRKRVK